VYEEKNKEVPTPYTVGSTILTQRSRVVTPILDRSEFVPRRYHGRCYVTEVEVGAYSEEGYDILVSDELSLTSVHEKLLEWIFHVRDRV